MFIRIKRFIKSISSVILPLIIIFTIPFAIYAVVNTNLDMRKEAREVDDEKCIVHLPYVNEKTLVVDKNYQLIVYANLANENIQKVEIRDRFGQEIMLEEYTSHTTSLLERFTYTPTKQGEEILQANVHTGQNIYSCKIEADNYLIVSENRKPTLLTNPYISTTNTITVNDEYMYRLEATDKDGDRIYYHYDIAPEADWIHIEVVENGKYGNLEIKFAGRPTETGSHLVNFYLHDGYKEHIVSQTWEINVKENIEDTAEIQKPPTPELPEIDSQYANLFKLNKPTITDQKPAQNTTMNQKKPMITAMLNASLDAEIVEESIELTLNQNTFDGDILEVSPDEFLIQHIPKNNLTTGEHQVRIAFTDTKDRNTEDIWTFTIESEESDIEIFGLPFSTIIIILIGFLLIIFSLSIPWLLYIAWKRNDEPDYSQNPVSKID